jgi:hypothetical protein
MKEPAEKNAVVVQLMDEGGWCVHIECKDMVLYEQLKEKAKEFLKLCQR